MRVTILHNDHPFTPFDPGHDQLVVVDRFELAETVKDGVLIQHGNSTTVYCTAELAGKPPDILDYIFRIHNRVDGTERVCTLKLRSLSVGDVVDLDGRSYACEPVGWRRLPN